MRKYFFNTKFTSFKRQLNIYDFKRITHGVDSCSYYREMFLRGKPLLAMKMVPRKIKGNIRVSTYIDNEPRFYSMPFLDPLSCPNDKSVEHLEQRPQKERSVRWEPSMAIKTVPRGMKESIKISTYTNNKPHFRSMPFMDPIFYPHQRRVEYFRQNPHKENSEIPSILLGEGHFNESGRSLTSSPNIQLVTEINISPRHNNHCLSQQHYYCQPFSVSFASQQQHSVHEENIIPMANQCLLPHHESNFCFKRSMI